MVIVAQLTQVGKNNLAAVRKTNEARTPNPLKLSAISYQLSAKQSPADS
jgi:hypothetical protein